MKKFIIFAFIALFSISITSCCGDIDNVPHPNTTLTKTQWADSAQHSIHRYIVVNANDSSDETVASIILPNDSGVEYYCSCGEHGYVKTPYRIDTLK